jgi:hypothetical protein
MLTRFFLYLTVFVEAWERARGRQRAAYWAEKREEIISFMEALGCAGGCVAKTFKAIVYLSIVAFLIWIIFFAISDIRRTNKKNSPDAVPAVKGSP